LLSRNAGTSCGSSKSFDITNFPEGVATLVYQAFDSVGDHRGFGVFSWGTTYLHDRPHSPAAVALDESPALTTRLAPME
jgi:hypothetical protein